MRRGLAFPVLLLFIALAGWWSPARWTLIAWVPLLLLAIYDVVQRRHTLWSTYTLIARVRWMFEALRPSLFALIVQRPLDGRSFPRKERDLISALATRDLDANPLCTT